VTGEDGRVDPERLKSVVYGHGRSYFGLGENLGRAYQARRKRG
jgi:hypothetical protein